jgi:hypothetical protein
MKRKALIGVVGMVWSCAAREQGDPVRAIVNQGGSGNAALPAEAQASPAEQLTPLPPPNDQGYLPPVPPPRLGNLVPPEQGRLHVDLPPIGDSWVRVGFERQSYGAVGGRRSVTLAVRAVTDEGRGVDLRVRVADELGQLEKPVLSRFIAISYIDGDRAPRQVADTEVSMTVLDGGELEFRVGPMELYSFVEGEPQLDAGTTVYPGGTVRGPIGFESCVFWPETGTGSSCPDDPDPGAVCLPSGVTIQTGPPCPIEWAPSP